MINFKQIVGLITLSIGVILMIYALRSEQSEATNGTLIAGITLLLGGLILSLAMNKQH